ncbi:MAG TPA: YdbH domain-containing protein [Allosphingosinicella sp.]|nr:YdbH domain-containing protein [Allosphingosinicella sp.]
MTAEQEAAAARRRLPRWRLVAFGLLLLVLLLIAAVWTQRRQIATDYIDRELARRGVAASYKVSRIGFRTQRIEQLVIGDPRRPDATARWVEVEISLGLRRPRVEMIRARGVRMRGRIVGGKLRLGEVDKLLPPPTDAPFRLPNQRVDIADAAMRLDTPAGIVGLAVRGSGNIAYSFEGRIAAVSTGLRQGDCRVDRPRLVAALTTEDDRPSLDGPLRADRVACGGVELTGPRLALRTTLFPRLDGAEGEAGVEVARLRSGKHRFDGVKGVIAFDGGYELLRGRMQLASGGATVGGYRIGRAAVDGRYAVAPAAGNASILADLAADGVAGGGLFRQAATMLGAADGTPLQPIGEALAAAALRVGQGFDARASLRFVNGRGYAAARVDRMRGESRSGARFALGGRGTGITYYWPGNRARIDGDFALSGGGFPELRLSLDQPRPGAPIGGEAWLTPIAAGGARLQLAPVRFTAGGGGSTRIETVAVIDGPFGGGRVAGLVVPVSGRLTGDGGFAFGERCTPVGFRSLHAAGLTLGPARLPLCPTGRALLSRTPGGTVMAAAEMRSPRLAGRIGSTPLSAAAGRIRFSLAERGFTGSGVTIGLGGEGHVNRFGFASLSGRVTEGGISGTFAGGEAKLAKVPLLMSEASGGWRMAGGGLVLDGSMSVADEAGPPRFHPLVTRDFRLALEDGTIRARGPLLDPETGTRVTDVTIDHGLAGGRGKAVLDVPGITFGETYQPEQLTRLTTGVVALVSGTVTGRGEIAWGPAGVTSTGSFATRDMDLAAAFGPVEGLSTNVDFTDLLGLVTAPGQTAEVGVIRTGIDVFDGLIRYQLLPGLLVRVEAGRWPFAGGELLLEETVLDFGKPSPKRLSFRVTGLDAATFIQQMEFSNISATGTFDGLVPMVFDERGGRIVQGRLAARAEGGDLSYIGELTDKQLGYYGKLAFDALKSMRYARLTIGLDGSLDGEFVASIELDGVARNAPAPGGIAGAVLNQLAKIPFEFNIKARGPFRALLGTARSLEDPSLLIQPALPAILRDRPTTTHVQPEESETVP